MKTCFVETNCKVIHISINSKMLKQKYQYSIVKQLQGKRIINWCKEPSALT